MVGDQDMPLFSINVTQQKSNDPWPKIKKELNYLANHTVAVGFFGEKNSMLLTIVRANEYGCTIVPKNGKWLTIPTKHDKTGHDGRPMNVAEFEKTQNVKLYQKGAQLGYDKNDGDFVAIFYLAKKVKIPQRSFIRAAFKNNQAKYKQIVDKGIHGILSGNMSGKQVLDMVGNVCVASIRKAARDLKDPANSPITVERKKGQNNPLVDTGNMLRMCTYQII